MKKVKLSSICNIASGGTPARSNSAYWKNGTIPWVKIGDITDKFLSQTSEHITQEGLNSSSAKLFPKGTILYTIFATLGEVAILNIAATTNQAIAGICLNDSRFTIQYLYYYLTSLKDYVNNIGRGVAQNNINLSILKNFEIPLRTLPEQEHIVESLTRVEQVIALRRAQLAKLDELVKCRFVEMFGDPVLNEKGWTCSQLGDVANVIGGYAFSSKQFAAAGIPVLRIGNINTGTFRKENLVFWSEDEKLTKYLIYPGDIVISLTGTAGKEDYGNVCVMSDDYPKYYLNQRNAVIRPTSCLLPSFLSYYMKSPVIKRKMTGIERGIRQGNISNSDITSLRIPMPPIYLQENFTHMVHLIDKLRFIAGRKKSFEHFMNK